MAWSRLQTNQDMARVRKVNVHVCDRHLPWARISRFFSEIRATVRCSENSVIFGRHAERSVTDEMSSFHSERLTPDNGQGEGQGRTARCGGSRILTIFALRHLFVSNKTSTDGTASCHSAIIHVAARHAGRRRRRAHDSRIS